MHGSEDTHFAFYELKEMFESEEGHHLFVYGHPVECVLEGYISYLILCNK